MNATHPRDLENLTIRLGLVARGGDLPRELSEDQLDWLSDQELRTEVPVDFAYSWEEAFSRTLDQHRILWQYKPRTFAVEWDDEGNFVDSFTPDFYLPLIDLYVELIGPHHHEASAKARKVRLLRQLQPGLRIKLLGDPATVKKSQFCVICG
jgi:hypoxanthine phosphoribosyltransferase